jgi:ABC-type lipoprotein release transport system permease subunit
MSYTEASEENVNSPSTYGNDAYQDYRKKEKKKNKTDPEKEGLNPVISYSKYAVGGESKEVPASAGLDENDNFIDRRKQNQLKQKKSRRTRKKENKSL